MGLSLETTVIQPKRNNRRGQSDAAEIPMDVIMEKILTRLPVRSLMRFESVSKLWSSIICSLYFNKRFLTLPSQPRPRLSLCLSELSSSRTSVILSSVQGTSNPSSFVVDHELIIPRMGKHVSHNLCGFMYYTFFKKMKIYNPSTRNSIILPAIKSYLIPLSEDPLNYNCEACYYIGHDPVSNEYKVICSISHTFALPTFEIKRISQHWVFVLKPGGFWKRVALPLVDFCPHVPVKGGLSIDGVIYYLADNVVVSFDIRSEEFMNMIQVPHKDGEEFRTLSLIEYGGKVTILDYTHLKNNSTMDLWVLEDAGNKEWLRKTLVLEPSQMHLVNNTILIVNGTTQNGKVILMPACNLSSPFYILCYDLQRNDMRKIEVQGIPNHWFHKGKIKICVDVMFMDQSESIIYLET